jgi:hypothetical protein
VTTIVQFRGRRFAITKRWVALRDVPVESDCSDGPWTPMREIDAPPACSSCGTQVPGNRYYESRLAADGKPVFHWSRITYDHEPDGLVRCDDAFHGDAP